MTRKRKNKKKSKIKQNKVMPQSIVTQSGVVQNSKTRSKIDKIKERHEIKILKKNNRIAQRSASIAEIRSFFQTIGIFAIYFLLALSIIGILIAFGVTLYLIIIQDDYYLIMSTIMQMLMGAVSVTVGIWALVLTIQAGTKSVNSVNRLNIVTSSTSSDIQTVAQENDVNCDTL